MLHYNRIWSLRILLLLAIHPIIFLGSTAGQDTDATEECPYPRLDCKPIDTERPNVFRCIVTWAPDDTLCLRNPPDPWEHELLAAQDTFTAPNQGEEEEEVIARLPEPPEWKYYYEISNGYYFTDSTDQLTVIFREPGDYRISMSATPIYSPNPRPPRREATIQILELNEGTLDSIPHSNFDEEDEEGQEVKIEADWPNIVPGDRVTMAITYRNAESVSEGENDRDRAKKGAVKIAIPNQGITFLGSRGAYTDAVTDQEIEGEKIFTWNIGEVPVGTERTIFADFQIGTGVDISNLSNQIELSAEVVWTQRRVFGIWCFLGFR